MPYEPSTDFVGLWRAISNGVEKAEMPGLDFVVAALGRAGILNVVFSEVPPEANQTTTAWFRTANPSYAAEGALYLWDARIGAYAPASPELFMTFLMYFTNDDMIAIFAVNGTPTDDIGKDGDYAIRLDSPGGIYGPKAGGHWPAQPIPGTSYSQISQFLDWLGSVQGEIVYRGSAGWTVLMPGSNGQTLKSGGAGANPFWGSGSSSSSDFDSLFGNTQGSVIYRGLSVWSSLGPAAAGSVLMTHGAGADPSWAALTGALDTNFGGVQGSVLVREAGGWVGLAPGSPGCSLVTNGAGADPSWSAGGIPINAESNYTTIASDAQKCVAGAGTITINSPLYPAGTVITFAGYGGLMTVTCSGGTLYWIGPTGVVTGNRMIPDRGIATALKMPDGNWTIGGNGMS